MFGCQFSFLGANSLVKVYRDLLGGWVDILKGRGDINWMHAGNSLGGCSYLEHLSFLGSSRSPNNANYYSGPSGEKISVLIKLVWQWSDSSVGNVGQGRPFVFPIFHLLFSCQPSSIPSTLYIYYHFISNNQKKWIKNGGHYHNHKYCFYSRRCLNSMLLVLKVGDCINLLYRFNWGRWVTLSDSVSHLSQGPILTLFLQMRINTGVESWS